MAHELMEYDNMISVHELPWHGLGVVLPDYVEAHEAQKLAGLIWHVSKRPAFFRETHEGMSRFTSAPGAFLTVRDDVQIALGMVGERYEAFQNDSMFDFMDEFCRGAGTKIETCGSLRNGATVWALAKAGITEYAKGDPVNEYFLFKNSFDGSSHIEICNTTIRVVCNNTLTMALNEAGRGKKQKPLNYWRVRHGVSMHEQIDQIKKAIEQQRAFSDQVAAVMASLLKHKMKSADVDDLATEIVVGNTFLSDDLPAGADDVVEKITKHQTKVVNRILQLHENGAGADIKGVRGTAYGVLQAAVEYADHYKTVRPGERTKAEAKFDSIMFGSAADFKATALDCAIRRAA